MSPGKILKIIGLGAAFLLFFFILLTVKFAWQSARFHREGEEAWQQEDYRVAEVWYDRSIRAHSLIGGAADKSAERLRSLAQMFEEQGKMKQAEQVWQTLLSALSAVDTGLSPQRARTIEDLKAKLDQMRAEFIDPQSSATQ